MTVNTNEGTTIAHVIYIAHVSDPVINSWHGMEIFKAAEHYCKD